jgi:hypothetical protein
VDRRHDEPTRFADGIPEYGQAEVERDAERDGAEAEPEERRRTPWNAHSVDQESGSYVGSDDEREQTGIEPETGVPYLSRYVRQVGQRDESFAVAKNLAE